MCSGFMSSFWTPDGARYTRSLGRLVYGWSEGDEGHTPCEYWHLLLYLLPSLDAKTLRRVLGLDLRDVGNLVK